MRHVLTLEERLRGVEGALRSRRTPSHLKPGLEVQRDELRRKLRERNGRERPPQRGRKAPGSLLDWLGL